MPRLTPEQRLANDVRDYQTMLAAWSQSGCGYRAAAREAGVSEKRGRRLWTRGVPDADLPPIRGLERDEDKATHRAARAAAQAPAATVKAVREVVVKSAEHAAADVSARIAAAMAKTAEAQVAIYEGQAKALEEEAALVDNARRTALSMLARLVVIVRSMGPLMESLAARVASDVGDMTTPQAFATVAKVLRIADQIAKLAEASMVMRRKLLGEAEATVDVRHTHTADDLSVEDARRELAAVQALLKQAEAAGHELDAAAAEAPTAQA